MSLLICVFFFFFEREGREEGEEAKASGAQGSMEVHITLVIFSYLWLESFAAPIH